MRVLRRIGLAFGLFVLLAGVSGSYGYWKSTQPYPVPAPPAPPSGPLEALAPSPTPPPNDRVVVVLVFDGLSARSIASVATPNFARLAAEGSHSSALLPVFPTLSMPNHFSLNTGCYPEHHGIVSNRFIDPKLGLFEHEKGDASWLLGCEPLNSVVERQGVRSANLGWVGATRGRKALASIVDEFQEKKQPSIAERTARVLELLQKPERERPQLIIAYYTQPDESLHLSGFDGERAKAAMRDADAAVGAVLQGFEHDGLRERAALLVTSDHGMIDAGTHLNVERILRDAGIDGVIAADGATAHVYLRDRTTRDAAVEKLQGRNELDAFTPEHAPAYAHLGQSQRLGDFIVQTRPGYYVFDRGLWPANLRWAAIYGPELLRGKRFAGMHGYPPNTPGIQGVFYAAGAGIVRGASLAGMESIDVHPTLAALLGVQPGANIDGHARTELLAPLPARPARAE